MYPGMYSQLAEIEDSHWWFISRRRLAETLLSSLNIKKNSKGLDIGCGTGGNLKLLKKYCSQVTGLDLSEFALSLAKKKWSHYKFIHGDANHLSKLFSPKSFGLITIFNVLYHQWVPNESKVLKQIYDILEPRGYLIITEPAFNFLKREHDIIDMGKCRYQLTPFRKLLKNSGFVVISSTYFNIIGFIPALITAFTDFFAIKKNKSIPDNKGAKELQILSKPLNKFLLKLMSLERKIIKSIGKIPLGVSLLCIAQKPASSKIS